MDRGNKSLIYVLITVLVIVLIIAIGVIVYMGMKMMDMQNAQANTKTVQKSTQEKIDVQEQVKKAIQEEMKEIKKQMPKDENEQKSSSSLKKEDIATIVGLVMAQMQQKQKEQKIPQSNLATKKESSDSLNSQLKELVDSQDNTVKKSKAKNNTTSTKGDLEDGNELDNLLTALESVDADSVDEDTGDGEIDLDSLNLDDVKAKDTKKTPTADTYNKVVVEDNNTADELAQLGGQIEQLVQKTSKKVKEESEYEKRMKREVKERKNAMRTIVVRRGDTLTLIAKRAYGSGRMYKKLLRANPSLRKNPNRIFVGQRLRVPR